MAARTSTLSPNKSGVGPLRLLCSAVTDETFAWTGPGAVEGMGLGQRVRTPSVSVHAMRFSVGEKEMWVITAGEVVVCLVQVVRGHFIYK